MPLQRLKRIVFITIALFLSSCIADDFEKLQDPDWSPELALPLINSRIDMERLVSKFNSDSNFVIDDENVVILRYNGTLFELRADELVKLEDVSFDLAPLQDFGVSNLPVQKFFLQNIEFETGRLSIRISDDLTEDTRVTLNLPETKKNGIAFSESFTVRYSGSATTTFDTIFDLTGYIMKLTGENGDEYNQLKVNYNALTLSNADSVRLNSFILSFENMDYSFIDGNLGYMNFGSHEDTMSLDIFKNFKSGRIILADPKFDLNVENSFGIPIKMSFGNFSASGEGGDADLTGKSVQDGVNVTSPDDRNDDPSNSKKEINTSNSNISEFLAITPGKLKYSFDLEANADGDTNAYNFVTGESEIIGRIALEIPLKGSLDSVVIEDIYDFNTDEFDQLEQAEFKLTTFNAFPVGMYVQIYFLNSDGVVLDSLIQTNSALFREAITNASGFADPDLVVNEESYFTVGPARFGTIRDQTTNLKIRIMMLTDKSDSRVVKITSEDFFDIKLGIRAVL